MQTRHGMILFSKFGPLRSKELTLPQNPSQSCICILGSKWNCCTTHTSRNHGSQRQVHLVIIFGTCLGPEAPPQSVPGPQCLAPVKRPPGVAEQWLASQPPQFAPQSCQSRPHTTPSSRCQPLVPSSRWQQVHQWAWWFCRNQPCRHAGPLWGGGSMRRMMSRVTWE